MCLRHGGKARALHMGVNDGTNQQPVRVETSLENAVEVPVCWGPGGSRRKVFQVALPFEE